MQLSISGQHMEVTPALREYVAGRVEKITRHFDHVSGAHVVLHVEKNRHMAEATLSARGATVHASASAGDMYAAIDAMADKLDRQVARRKEKRADHHRGDGAKNAPQ
ncbi:MAG: ribosome-associated translation inhibitor RaiA [Gammaproteobacteria bacterium]|nr:ribosome-associated translation inhibitor RaiA [Gammaproteobacteria bacterium]CAJ2377079.1 MAG: ribosome hibernation-promoting factor [Arenicellales bacterium IbO2]MDA7961279.1 ribosome-associated translation inhibitor RaiA [Gammaproteobacteria bacterium]MDA7968349.1 ribosome-associated translation inhibitor RaiA [Gammaproteobacteria bacterium]MDA7969321.1 ribosome-associated translation inhibitor RaiA [Gammaproteobacteria bacterium]